MPVLVVSWDDLETEETAALASQRTDGHADEIETSINLCLQPERVRMDRAVADLPHGAGQATLRPLPQRRARPHPGGPRLHPYRHVRGFSARRIRLGPLPGARGVRTPVQRAPTWPRGTGAFFALAEELDVPVGIHMGLGPPGAAYGPSDDGGRSSSARGCARSASAASGLYVSHYLRRLVEAGFGLRIMFGSDQMVWPDAIGRAIEVVEAAPFLSVEQRRDIM